MAIAPWKHQPVFISSTFRDMNAERDALRARVFPALAERLRARRCHLESVDLRWGVETASLGEQEAKELQVLSVCLTDIERSRPFLIVLVGDRYGWIPPPERSQRIATEKGIAFPVAGISVTALEIEYGVLADERLRPRSFFYFREGLDPIALGAAAATFSDRAGGDHAAAAKQDALKARIRQLHPDRVRSYHPTWDAARQRVDGLDELCRLVEEDLWRELDAETAAFAAAPQPTAEDLERAALADFVEHRARGFVGRDALLADLEALVRSPTSRLGYTGPRREAATDTELVWGTVLAAEPGAGKSAVFAELVKRLSGATHDGKPIVLLTHAFGATPGGAGIGPVQQRWIQELGAFLGRPLDLPEQPTAEDLDKALASGISQASVRGRVVCLLDALDQADASARSRSASWLPRFWSDNARLIATGISGTEALEALAGRCGVRRLTLAPLGEREAGTIADGICARYHRTLNPAVRADLLARRCVDGSPACGNPLWLTLAVEDLNALDTDDFAAGEARFAGLSPEQRLLSLLRATVQEHPTEIPGLYRELFARAAAQHGAAWARAFTALLAVGRQGWREQDLQVLLPRLTNEPWNDLRFARLRRSLAMHLVERQGAWAFFHRQAVLAGATHLNAAGIQALHAAIAEHLDALPAEDPWRQRHLVHHLIGADRSQRVQEIYGDPELPEAMRTAATEDLGELLLSGESGSNWVIGLVSEPSPGDPNTDDRVARVCVAMNEHLNAWLTNQGTLADGERLLVPARGALVAIAERRPSWLERVDDLHRAIGDVWKSQGRSHEARQAFEASRDINERLVDKCYGNSDWQSDLRISYSRIGSILMVQGDLSGALLAFRKALVISESLAAQAPDSAEWQNALGVSKGWIGDVLEEMGDYRGAMKQHKEFASILEGVSKRFSENAEWQRRVAISYNRIGHIHELLGEYAEAIDHHNNCAQIMNRLAVVDPRNPGYLNDISKISGRIGGYYYQQSDLIRAKEYFGESLSTTLILTAQDPGNTDWLHNLSVCHANMGSVRQASGDSHGALEQFRAALVILGHIIEQDPDNVDWQRDLGFIHNKIGSLLQAEGDLVEALDQFRRSLAISEHLAVLEPDNAGWQNDLGVGHNKIGGILEMQGDHTGARGEYSKALTILEVIASSENPVSQFDMAVTHAALARLAERSGDSTATQAHDRKAAACAWTPATIVGGFRKQALPLLIERLAGIVADLPTDDRLRIARCCTEALATRTNLPDRASKLSAFMSHLPDDDPLRQQTA
jgi:tetratricopeptide (TPR) repeat protein